MNINFKSKSTRSVALVLVVGLVLGAMIVFWKKDGEDTSLEQQSAGQGKTGGPEKKAEHAEAPEGVIALSEQQIRSAGITTAKVAPATIEEAMTLSGEVRFNEDRTAHVVPRVPGVAESVAANLGQSVRQGQVLAVISSAELADLRSNALAAQKRLGLARLTYLRERKLWEDKISAEQDYLQAQQAFREAEITVQTANAKLSALGANSTGGALSSYQLRAPFDSVVLEKHITRGEMVKEDANVFLLSDLSTVWVDVVIPARDIEAVRVGAVASVNSTSSNLSATGKVSYVGALIGEQTRSANARVVLRNPENAWRPGLFVNVALARGTKKAALAVAPAAVQTVEGKTVVYVRTTQGFKARNVTTGSSDGKAVEIVSGLEPGAEYVINGSFVLKAEQGKDSAEHDD